ncbi:hypothetical protein HBI56_165870 [Parastagonospora nodorum]|nr:hypothetical protein HBH53_054510 [Parastagonospora nodorum]KAH3994985.1 hypothetical protein HBI10_180530 [Parastagonospora nodorum]KAH4015015.1 hypothetical protein HBI13_165660 [Parastagonospora nodorum]KAH4045594.1 hypothetical protein HBH49_199700 [Parastagonospora nodorum]KAH4173917.1 hypothetical protein HBH43_084750 [Parastagonospora nodorum]
MENPILSISPALVFTALAICLVPAIALYGLALSQRDTPLPPPAGCRRLGLQGPSNLEDQHSKRFARGGTRTPANPWTVKAIFIYPLKSCAPVELDNTEVLRTGLMYDRQFTFGQFVSGLPSMDGKVNSEWQFMSLRKFPRLAKVETEVWYPDPSAPGYSEDGEWVLSEGCLLVRFPFSPDTDFSFEGLKNWGKILAAKLAKRAEPMLEFRVPFNPPNDRIKRKGYKSQELKIWKDAPQALDVSPEIDPEILAKLKYTLGTSNPVTLFRINPEQPRVVTKNAPKKADVGFQTTIGMQDSYPVHILNLASVHDVASKLPRQEGPWQLVVPLLNALRFRANIYITGPPAFHEDAWLKARISSPNSSYAHDPLDLNVSCRTTRCKLPNVDPETAIADRNEPYSTLRQYRIIDEGNKNPCLGMQVVPLQSGEVKVGDYIEVLESGNHLWIGAEGKSVVG